MKPAVAATADPRAFVKAVVEFAAASGKDVSDEMRNQARLFTEDIITLTPPGGPGRTGVAARKAGEEAIAGDIFGGREVDMGGFKVRTDGLFIVSNVDPHEASGGYVAEFQSQNDKPTFRKKREGEEDAVSLYTTKKGKVYGVERQLFRPNATVSEMLSHIDRYRSKATGRVTRAGLRSKTIGRHVFIDKMVISPAAKQKLLKELYLRVGMLAAGFLPAAQALGARRVPAWIRRQAGRAHGAIRITTRDRGIEIEIINDPAYGDTAAVKALRRRIQSALDMRALKMTRQIPFILVKNARRQKL